MSYRRAYVNLELEVDLPDDPQEADTAFDAVVDRITTAVDKVDGVADYSTSVRDADTRP